MGANGGTLERERNRNSGYIQFKYQRRMIEEDLWCTREAKIRNFMTK